MHFDSHDHLNIPYTGEVSVAEVPPAYAKPFKLGFMLGRFQHIHKGHEMVINTALNVCDKVILLIGSSQEEGTLRNPFPVETREELIRKVYKNHPNLIIDSIDDMTNEEDHSTDWGKYVLARVAYVAHKNNIPFNPEVMIYGNDEERQGWFNADDIDHVSQLVMTRGNIEISATKIREFIIENNFWKWRQYTNESIHGKFYKLREHLLSLDTYKEEN